MPAYQQESVLFLNITTVLHCGRRLVGRIASPTCLGNAKVVMSFVLACKTRTGFCILYLVLMGIATSGTPSS